MCQSGCSCHIPASSVQDLTSHQHWMWLLAFIVASDTHVMMSPCSCNWHSPGLMMSTFHVCLCPCPQWNGRPCLASCLIVMFGFFTFEFWGLLCAQIQGLYQIRDSHVFSPKLVFSLSIPQKFLVLVKSRLSVSLLWVKCLMSQNPTSSRRSQRIRLVFSFS